MLSCSGVKNVNPTSLYQKTGKTSRDLMLLKHWYCLPISDILGALTSIMNFETQELRALGDVTPYNENSRLGVTSLSLLDGQLWKGWKCTVMKSMQSNCDGVCDIHVCVGVNDVMEYIVFRHKLMLKASLRFIFGFDIL